MEHFNFDLILIFKIVFRIIISTISKNTSPKDQTIPDKRPIYRDQAFWAAVGCRYSDRGRHRFPSNDRLGRIPPKLVRREDEMMKKGCRLVSKLVSLHDFPSGLLLVAAALPCPPSLSPFTVSLLGCSWLPLLRMISPLHLLLAAAATSPSLSLGCSWLPLLRMISSLGLLLVAAAALSSQLVTLPDFPSGLLLAAAAALSPSLSPFLISLLGCSWLPLPPCLLGCFPSWFVF